MASSSSSSPIPATRPDPIPRARPVIELNLNVEDAMIEAVDLLRTIRVQLEAITGTVNERLNRTFSDAGDDVAKIIHNVETLSSNLAASTGQFYQPILFSLLFLLLLLILFGTLVCIFCHVRKEMEGRRRRQNGGKKKSKSAEKDVEEGSPIVGKNVEDDDEGEEAGGRAATRKRRQPFGWLRRFRTRRPNNGNGQRRSSQPSRSPELEELREKELRSVEFHETSTMPKQQKEPPAF